MAGRALLNAMIDELDRRTSQAFDGPATHMDYVCDWIEQGQTAKQLAAELNVEWGFLRRHLERNAGSGPSCDERLTRARLIGSHALVDETLAIADGANEDNVNVAKLRVGVRQWTAEKWNPAYGQRQQSNVTINVGSLHLEALQRYANKVTSGSTMKALPSSDAVVLPSQDDAQ